MTTQEVKRDEDNDDVSVVPEFITPPVDIVVNKTHPHGLIDFVHETDNIHRAVPSQMRRIESKEESILEKTHKYLLHLIIAIIGLILLVIMVIVCCIFYHKSVKEY